MCVENKPSSLLFDTISKDWLHTCLWFGCQVFLSFALVYLTVMEHSYAWNFVVSWKQKRESQITTSIKDNKTDRKRTDLLTTGLLPFNNWSFG